MRDSAKRLLSWTAAALPLALAAGGLPLAARADQPRAWEINLQAPASPLADKVASLHTELLWIIGAIVLLVTALLLYVCFRFRAARNPTPSRTSHNTVIEILWTALPVLILAVIVVPSIKLIYYQEEVPKSDFTLKVTGNQWFWHYDYPDQGNFGFDSYNVDDKDLKPGQPRLLEVDNEVVLPVDSTVRVQIAGNDVMHSWFIPSLGIQKYAIVGKLNETWIHPEKLGTYYGECNQICGVNHAYMPIKVHVVSKDEFQQWLGQAKKKFAQGNSAVQLASAEKPAAVQP